MKRLAALAVGMLLLWAGAARAADTVYYYSSDTLHSEVVITDATRNVVERTYYAPYGQVLNRDLRDGPGYTGHEEDPETNLVYMQQRYYDPEAGRFLSTDPVQADGGGGSFNRYEYANDNPYRYTDPDGRQVTVIVAACAADPACAVPVVTGLVALGAAAKKAGDAGARYYDHVMQSKQEKAKDGASQAQGAKPNSSKTDHIQQATEHTKGARPSTEGKHEKGQARAAKDKGGEKGDRSRSPYRKRPPSHKGPWPPKKPPNDQH